MNYYQTGGTATTDTASTTSTTPVNLQRGEESALSSWAGPYVTEMLGRGQALASMPYTAYQGPLTAGPSALQQQAFGGLGSLALPGATAAGSFTGAAYQPLTPEQIAGGETPQPFAGAGASPVQAYMNPYLQAALQPQYDAAMRQAQIAQQELQSRYGKAGAYGGSRQAVAEAELARGTLDRLADITGQGYQQAYQQASDLFGRERDYGLEALRAQRQAGAEQRAIEQAGITADIEQFEQERDFPFKQVQYMQSLLQGLPLETQTYTYYEPSGLAALTGGYTTGQGLYDLIMGGGDAGTVPTPTGESSRWTDTAKNQFQGVYDYYTAIGLDPKTAAEQAMRDLGVID